MDLISLVKFTSRCLIICTVILQYGNTAPFNDTDANGLEDRIAELEGNYSSLSKLVHDLEARIKHLEMEDTWHCKESHQTIDILKNVGFTDLSSDDDDDDDDDDDEDDDNNDDDDDDDDDDHTLQSATEATNKKENRPKNNYRGKIGCRIPGPEGKRSNGKPVNSAENPNGKTEHPDHDTDKKPYTKKVNFNCTCNVRPNKALPPERRPDVRGKVVLSYADNDKLIIRAKLQGLRAPGRMDSVPIQSNNTTFKYGFHVHEYADFQNGCESAGEHFNPYRRFHGGPPSSPGERHMGDLGNVESDYLGNVDATYVYGNLTADILIPNTPFSFVGKPIVIHAKEDDLGKLQNNMSAITGNSGERIGCCMIIC